MAIADQNPLPKVVDTTFYPEEAIIISPDGLREFYLLQGCFWLAYMKDSYKIH